MKMIILFYQKIIIVNFTELINQIRIETQSYIQIYKESKKKITKNKSDERFIYKGKIKIALNEGGENAF